MSGNGNYMVESNNEWYAEQAEKLVKHIDAINAESQKEMDNNPRRISAIRIHIHFPNNYSDKEKKLLEKTSHTCPVGKSLNDQLEEEISFHYPN